MRKLLTNHEKILHQKFVQYGSSAKEWMRKCVLLLPEIARFRLWERKGFGSIYEYAAKLAGMSRDQVNEGLRVLAKISDKPELQKVVEEKGINAVKPVITLVTPETAEFWAEKVRTMSKNTLELYVKEVRNQNLEFGLPRKAENAENPQQQAIENFEDAGSTPTKIIVTMNLDPEVAQQLQKLKGQSDWNELMKQFLEMREEKIEAQKPQRGENAKRPIPTKIKKYVSAKTNGNCAYPGCKKSAEIYHHTQRFVLEKTHDPDQIVPLCKAHERLVHLGLVQNEERAAADWQVRSQADKTNPRYRVDQLVAKYRMFK